MSRGKKLAGKETFQYERLAAQVASLIEQGTYQPGDRIPSVRQMSQQQNLSISTVLQAYALLERQGLIEARPQSGYYVRSRVEERLPEPETSSPQLDPSHVSLHDLVMMLMRDSANPNLAQLGAALPHLDPRLIQTINRTMAKIIRQHGVDAHQYQFPPGFDALRVQIAQRMVNAGCSLSPGEILITCGGTEAIDFSLHAVCRPGDIVAIESPSYFGTLQTLEAHGLRALEIPTHPRDGISLEALEFAIEHNPIRAVVVISNFNNPFGSCMPDEKKKELVKILASQDIPLIENDVYGDLGFSYDRPRVAKRYDKKGLVILCSSFSKTLAPGYRVGWVVPGRFQEKIERLKAVSNIATATLPQLAIAEFLSTGGYDQYLRRIRGIYGRQTSLMAQAVKKHFPRGTEVSSPSGGFVLWVEMPEYVDSIKLYEQTLNRGITIAPGLIFSASRKYRNFIRLNAAYWSDRIEKSLAIVGELASGMAAI